MAWRRMLWRTPARNLASSRYNTTSSSSSPSPSSFLHGHGRSRSLGHGLGGSLRQTRLVSTGTEEEKKTEEEETEADPVVRISVLPPSQDEEWSEDEEEDESVDPEIKVFELKDILSALNAPPRDRPKGIPSVEELAELFRLMKGSLPSKDDTLAEPDSASNTLPSVVAEEAKTKAKAEEAEEEEDNSEEEVLEEEEEEEEEDIENENGHGKLIQAEDGLAVVEEKKTFKERNYMNRKDPVLILEEVEEVLEKTRARDVKIFHVNERCDWTDVMVFATGISDRHVRGVAEALVYKVKKKPHIDPLHYPVVEGQGGQWLVVDCGNIIIHVLGEEAREYYNLEGIWSRLLENGPNDRELDKLLQQAGLKKKSQARKQVNKLISAS